MNDVKLEEGSVVEDFHPDDTAPKGETHDCNGSASDSEETQLDLGDDF